MSIEMLRIRRDNTPTIVFIAEFCLYILPVHWLTCLGVRPKIAAPGFPPMIGKSLGHYRILEKIGAGGMGEVYRAHDEQLGRDVAIKLLPASSFSEPAARARLIGEARSAASLNHPHICTIHEVGEADGQAYIAMELVQGQPLSARLAGGALPTEQVLRYGLQLAEALGHAHERGVVHRDLKSANVVITTEGRAKVLDFGLAKRLTETEMDEVTRSQASLTAAGALVGTLAYMAPEQLRGQPADARSDVWALGVVLYEMAAGARPFQGKTGFELSSAILNQSPPPPGKVVPELRAVIERCLEKEPARRYQRGGEVQAALEAIQTGAVAPWVAWRYRLARRRWLALVATVVVVVAVLTALNLGGLRERLLTLRKIESIAVLPLENLSHDPEQEYFADGMTEELITNLAKISALKVISRTSVMQYKGTKKPSPQIAKELNVDAVIEGSVLREGGQVRITAQLIQASTDRHLWAESYERDLRGVLALQSEVARAIAQKVHATLTPDERVRLASARPVNPDSHEAYLRGRYFWNQRNEESLKKALEYFQQAVNKDPGYAQAYSGLADTYFYRGYAFGRLVPREAMPKARAAALKALEIDDHLAEAHCSLALEEFFYEWDWAGAEKEFKRSIELNPSYPTAHHGYAILLATTGRTEESLAEAHKALQADPLSLPINNIVGSMFNAAHQYDRAIEQIRKTLEMAPNFALAHSTLGGAYQGKGRLREAVEEYLKAKSLEGESPQTVTSQRHAYETSGMKGFWQKELELALSRWARDRWHWGAFDIGGLYLNLGQKDQAFRWFDKAYEARSGSLVWLFVGLKADDPLRSDPRFQDLLRRMSFPP